jgi:hypothetical protein
LYPPAVLNISTLGLFEGFIGKFYDLWLISERKEKIEIKSAGKREAL